MEELLAPRRSSYARVFLKGLLRSIVKPIALVRIWYKRDRLRGLIVFCLLLGGYYYLTGASEDKAFVVTDVAGAHLGEQPVAIDAFVRGQIEFDAAKIWSGLNLRFREELSMRGESSEKTQLFIDIAREQLDYSGTQFIYVGHESITFGNSYFYVGEYHFGSKSFRAPITITVDDTGRITSLASPEFCKMQIFFTLYCAIPGQ